MEIFGNVIGLIALICAIWVIYDVLANQKRMSTATKAVWIICAVLFSIITAIVYYFFSKK